MRNLSRKTSLVFAAGCLGGLLNSLAVWISGDLGITAALGVKIAPQLLSLIHISEPTRLGMLSRMPSSA